MRRLYFSRNIQVAPKPQAMTMCDFWYVPFQPLPQLIRFWITLFHPLVPGTGMPVSKQDSWPYSVFRHLDYWHLKLQDRCKLCSETSKMLAPTEGMVFNPTVVLYNSEISPVLPLLMAIFGFWPFIIHKAVSDFKTQLFVNPWITRG